MVLSKSKQSDNVCGNRGIQGTYGWRIEQVDEVRPHPRDISGS